MDPTVTLFDPAGAQQITVCKPSYEMQLRHHPIRITERNLAIVVGHEIVGQAVRVGKNVKHIKVGDRCGVGAQSDSCLECKNCKNGHENHCPKMVNTYGGQYSNTGKEGKSMGGYATYSRAPGHFVFKIPENLASEDAAPSEFCLL